MEAHFNFKGTKALSISIIALFLFTIVFTACNKDNNNKSPAIVMAVNAAQGSDAQDIYINNTKLNTSAIAYTQNTTYLGLVAGTYNGQFKSASTSTVSADFSFSFLPGVYYTIFYAGNNTAVASIDDRISSMAGKSRIRVINLNPALTTIDVAVTTGGSVATGLAYKAMSNYYYVDPASTFTVATSGSGTVLLNIPTTVEVGKVYTICISGTTTANATYTIINQ